MKGLRDGEAASGGPEDRLLTWNRVKPIAGISRTTAWRMQKAGDFPAPVPISPHRVGWWESELTAWKLSRKARAPFRSPRKPKPGEGDRSCSPAAGAAPSPPPADPARLDKAKARGGAEGAGSAARVAEPVQRCLPLEAPAPVGKPARRRRRQMASPDQIDFGF